MTQKIIIICGPTAVGKTAVGIELSRRFNGEILSADSCQVWRGFDIGTAKANLKERSNISHHLVDVAGPTEHFDAARFVGLADAAIKEIAARGKVPFIVGGTGMYLRMLVHGLCGAPPQDEDVRRILEAEMDEVGLEALHEKLKAVDPESALKIHPNDKTRILRALEIHRITGVPASRFRNGHGFGDKRYDALKIGLNIERKELYRRIDERVDKMIGDGLVGEVRDLLSRYDVSCQPFTAVGYREIVAHLKGEVGLDDAISLTEKNSRHFAKRQLTWFNADSEIRWFSPDDLLNLSEAIIDFLGVGEIA